ncbi:MAG: hypothetical protein JSW46_02090 [Gemmatimonadota bacterium]|nr:MAG: hypothetical protein JSW46_02090 [Gemmatimonadota bacterium]
MNEPVKLCAVGVVALMIAACGPQQTADEAPADTEARPQVTIEVQNQNFYDARVYVVEAGRTARRRLGAVPGNERRTLSFRVEPMRVRFVVDFIGSGELTTEFIQVSPGDELVLSVTARTHQLRIRG